MKPQTKTYKHVIDLYFESVPHSIRTFSVHGNTLIYIEYEDYLNEHHNGSPSTIIGHQRSSQYQAKLFRAAIPGNTAALRPIHEPA